MTVFLLGLKWSIFTYMIQTLSYITYPHWHKWTRTQTLRQNHTNIHSERQRGVSDEGRAHTRVYTQLHMHTTAHPAGYTHVHTMLNTHTHTWGLVKGTRQHTQAYTHKLQLERIKRTCTDIKNHTDIHTHHPTHTYTDRQTKQLTHARTHNYADRKKKKK